MIVPGWLSCLSRSDTTYCTGFGLPLNAGSGVKVTLPVVGSTFHSPSPATFSSVTFAPVVGSSSLTLVLSIVLSPCGSVSFFNTSISTALPGSPFMLSAFATGASLPGCGGLPSVSVMTSASGLVWVPSLLCALTVLPSFTASGAMVTLPVVGSMVTPLGRVPFGVHLPLASLPKLTLCGWPCSSV